MSTLAAEPANGQWRLVVIDDLASDTGNIRAWSIHFAPAPATVPTMTEWAMMLFGLILAGGAAATIHRRRRAISQV